MPDGIVGARILNIITESLYDKPIVVFREYVQNSVDSFQKSDAKPEELYSKIWRTEENLFFLDNGDGVSQDKFLDAMRHIAHSSKSRINDVGYKGIGRLSGLPYCDKLVFVNILSFKQNIYQTYYLDGAEYNKIKNRDDINDLTFEEFIDEIGSTETPKELHIDSIIASNASMFEKQDTGFLVVLDNINFVLKHAIERDSFPNKLGWLLPVKFCDSLLSGDIKNLVLKMQEPAFDTSVIPAKHFNVYYNDKLLERPLTPQKLRRYTCKTSFSEYAVGFHSFNQTRFTISKGNDFTGIRLYIDNILLCDETELIPALLQYGLLNGSSNELIQTVKSIGAIIYITDKINISANARRTFIELTDADSYDFMRLLADFVSRIYSARYSLSRYRNAENSQNKVEEKVNALKAVAIEALKNLAKDEIKIDVEQKQDNFEDLSPTDQKKAIKKEINKYLNPKIKAYLQQTTDFDYDNAVNDFLTWFDTNR